MTSFNLLFTQPDKLRQQLDLVSYKNKATYQLRPLADIPIDHTAAQAIADVCNEPLVYHWLFKDKLKNKSYHPERARVFLEWAHEGWQQSKYFAYAICYQENIVGAIDIKSAETHAEIGYWLSQQHSGVMTSAVKAIIRLAKDARYQRLYAYTALENDRSAKVLARAGFIYQGKEEKHDEMFKRFEHSLC